MPILEETGRAGLPHPVVDTAAVAAPLGVPDGDVAVVVTDLGVPIGSFQAVKHHLADARPALEFARPAVARAAWSLAQGEGYDPRLRARDVSMAKALATDAAEACGRAALQCHGAIGDTIEHDLHLYLRRSWALARAWGDRRFHAERVGQALAASLGSPISPGGPE